MKLWNAHTSLDCTVLCSYRNHQLTSPLLSSPRKTTPFTQLGLDKAVLAHARNEAQQEAEDGDVSIGDSRGMISTRGTGKVGD